MALETSVLRIKAEQLGSIEEIKSLLTDLELAYNSIYAFELIIQAIPSDIQRSLANLANREKYLDDFIKRSQRKDLIYEYERLYNLMEYFYFDGRRLLPSLKNYYENLDTNNFVGVTDKLMLSKVNIQSPGFWEFLGTANPLNQIREYLKDRHERNKDKEYRSAQEKRKGELDIMEKEDGILNGRIDMLKKLGFSDIEIRQMVVKMVVQPLHLLDKYQDNGQIEGPEDDTPEQ